MHRLKRIIPGAGGGRDKALGKVPGKQRGSDHYKLNFTGSCDQETFDRVCGQQDIWYHSYFFDNGYSVRGDYDIGLDIDDYGFPNDMTGMRVLDVGTASGWFAFYFEQKGAEVTAFDARGYSDWDMYGRYENPPPGSGDDSQILRDKNGEKIYLNLVSGGFWKMRELLGSQVKFVTGRVYDIRPELFDGQKFDLVFYGSLLLHLRDPIGALMAGRKVCVDRLIAATPILADDNPHPHMDLPYLAGQNRITWWRPNKACYRLWFLAAGFTTVDVERTVNLTVDIPVPEHDNITQTLQVAEARV